MLTNNICVANGLANGSQAEVSTVYLDSNIPIQGVLACDVDHVCLRHTNKQVQPQDFIVSPKEFCFQASILKPSVLQCKGSPNQERIHMIGMQLPIVVIHAKTGHKLQVLGVNNILVNSWCYQANWPYVMLSRVRTYNGLFMSRKLSANLKHYRLPPKYIRILCELR